MEYNRIYVRESHRLIDYLIKNSLFLLGELPQGDSKSLALCNEMSFMGNQVNFEVWFYEKHKLTDMSISRDVKETWKNAILVELQSFLFGSFQTNLALT